MTAKTALSTSFDTAAAASSQLHGIPVETAPTVAIAFSTPPAAPPGAKEEESGGSGFGRVAGAAAGATVAVLLLVAAVFCQRKRCGVQNSGASSLNQVELGGLRQKGPRRKAADACADAK